MGGSHRARERRGLRRYVIASLALGLLAALLIAVPAAATGGHHKWAPALRVLMWTNDDGRARHADPGDTGVASPAYDRWGHRSSDDPTEVGMDPARIDSDVARCKAIRVGRSTFRLRIQNAYPGYACTFRVVTVNRVGSTLVVDRVIIDPEPGIELVELSGPSEGDIVKPWRRIRGTYGVTVLQEAPQGETLEFDIEVSFIKRHKRPPVKCCLWCWR
ncbi:MAG: hypothetical protein QNJ81_10970 [Acidimicrobiia bacterium]|nr:hypothetical protein [Acidimicrobiia bacterium]